MTLLESEDAVRTRTGRHRRAVLVVYLVLVVVAVVVLGTRFVPPHQLSAPTRSGTSAADAEGY